MIVLLPREAREVVDDDEMDLALVRPAVLQQVLQFAPIRRLVGMSVVVALLATASLRAQSGSSSPSKSSTADHFTVLDIEAQRGRPATVDELTQQLTTWGFKRTGDSGS